MICNILVSKNQDCPACTVRLFKGRRRRLNLSHLCFIITTNVFRNIHSYVHVLSDPSLWSLSFAPLLQSLSVDASMTASFSNGGQQQRKCKGYMQFTGARLVSHGTLNSLLWKKISQRRLCQRSSAAKQQPQSSVLGSSLSSSSLCN